MWSFTPRVITLVHGEMANLRLHMLTRRRGHCQACPCCDAYLSPSIWILLPVQQPTSHCCFAVRHVTFEEFSNQCHSHQNKLSVMLPWTNAWNESCASLKYSLPIQQISAAGWKCIFWRRETSEEKFHFHGRQESKQLVLLVIELMQSAQILGCLDVYLLNRPIAFFVFIKYPSFLIGVVVGTFAISASVLLYWHPNISFL